jgi:hypothetical protein
MGLAALGILAAGAYIGTKLTNSGRERRQETIERAVNETFKNLEHDEPRADGTSSRPKR